MPARRVGVVGYGGELCNATDVEVPYRNEPRPELSGTQSSVMPINQEICFPSRLEFFAWYSQVSISKMYKDSQVWWSHKLGVVFLFPSPLPGPSRASCSYGSNQKPHLPCAWIAFTVSWSLKMIWLLASRGPPAASWYGAGGASKGGWPANIKLPVWSNGDQFCWSVWASRRWSLTSTPLRSGAVTTAPPSAGLTLLCRKCRGWSEKCMRL
jgi:hypothetical protein